MTKHDLIELIKDAPDDSIIDIYDLRNFSHPDFKLDLETYFDYDVGCPIITFELN